MGDVINAAQEKRGAPGSPFGAGTLVIAWLQRVRCFYRERRADAHWKVRRGTSRFFGSGPPRGRRPRCARAGWGWRFRLEALIVARLRGILISFPPRPMV